MSLIQFAEDLFRTALAQVEIPARMAAHVRWDGERLRVGAQEYQVGRYRRIGLIAIGKAAASMSNTFIGILGASPTAKVTLQGIVVSATVPDEQRTGLTYIAGGHPVPTRASLHAAEAILTFLSGFGPEDLVIYLISGGASAMVERALDPQFSFEDTLELYRALLRSGLSIEQMNCVRKHFSGVKGGRLAMATAGATQISLLVSDVPGDDLSVIGSGPSMPDPSTVQECSRVLQDLLARVEISPRLGALLKSLHVEETPKSHDQVFSRCSYTSILSAKDLLDSAAKVAEKAGCFVAIDNHCDDWDCAEAATYLLDRLRELRARHGRVCLLSSGELSVRLPNDAGNGGRNQHFALACALLLQDGADRITVLSAGTDGIDGNSPAAGAVVNQQTCSVALARGIDPQSYFDRFDSYTFFRMLDAAIVTGPTENNLRDLRVLLCDAEA